MAGRKWLTAVWVVFRWMGKRKAALVKFPAIGGREHVANLPGGCATMGGSSHKRIFT